MLNAHIILQFFESVQFTINDLDSFEKDLDREVARTARILIDMEDEYPKEVAAFFAMANKAIMVAIKPLKGVYVHEKELKRRLLGSEFPSKVQDFFPLPVYVSSSKSDQMTIGLLVHFNGKLEMFEGNDEATSKTIEAVNQLLNIVGLKMIVFGMHTEDLVNKIYRTNKIPVGLYVSPDRKYASGHWRVGQQRVLFSCQIDMGDVSQESEYDWKVVRAAKVRKVRIY